MSLGGGGDPHVPTRSAAVLPDAGTHFVDVRARLGARRPVFFLDYDGTLAPIARRPEEAHLPPATREVLLRLAERHPVWIVSGRDAADVQAMVGIRSIGVIGNHGLERLLPDGTHREDAGAAAVRADLAALGDVLEARLRPVQGAWVERKRFAVVAHDREVEDGDLALVNAAVDASREAFPALRCVRGRRVYEFRPKMAGDKGTAVRELVVEAGGAAAVCPVYVGDDTTDEDAFSVVRGEGIAVLVRHDDRKTAAAFALDDPGAVRAFLARFLEDT